MIKRYLALCAGQPPDAGEIVTGHGRGASGRWRVYLPEEIGAALPGGGGRVKLAHTRYSVLRRIEGAALVQASPHTGRTHQIRLHLAHIGHPLLGDTRYGGPTSYATIPLPGHLLHAASLALAHPITGQQLELESPTPDAFTQLLND